MTASLPPVAILAGGLATRMRPLTETVPKAMLEVGGEPFIAHQLRLLAAQGIPKAVICAGFLAEQIQGFVGNGEKFGLQVEFVLDGPVLLGTGGAIRNALPHLGNRFYITYGDAYLDDDYRAFDTAWRESGREALMVVYRNFGKGDTSNARFDGKLVQYDKKIADPDIDYIDWGVSMLQASAFNGRKEGEKFDISEVLAGLSRRGELAGFETKNRFYEIGSPQGLADTEAVLAAMRNQIR
ncbi:MAG: NTP transferase domain-containing protein [Alphaproteobacteria bacterium]|nr:NTP transferase domain-containing protein [Alphaproteobacteria bacterium]